MIKVPPSWGRDLGRGINAARGEVIDLKYSFNIN